MRRNVLVEGAWFINSLISLVRLDLSLLELLVRCRTSFPSVRLIRLSRYLLVNILPPISAWIDSRDLILVWWEYDVASSHEEESLVCRSWQ